MGKCMAHVVLHWFWMVYHRRYLQEKSLRGKHSSLLNEKLFIKKGDIVVLQSATDLFITKLRQGGITKYCTTAILLQSATSVITKLTSVITKCDRYKVRRYYL